MANPRSLANMTPEQIEEKVEALSPAWAKDYIRRLEGLTRALAAQIQAAQPAIDFARSYSEMTGGNGGIPDPSLLAATLRPEAMGQAAAAFATEIRSEYRQSAAQDPDMLEDLSSQTQPSVWTPAGITPPDGEYATVRVVDGAANMEPVADLPDRAEIRFADFYQAHYGSHESTGGMRLLVIEADGPIQVRPVSQATVLIARGGTESR